MRLTLLTGAALIMIASTQTSANPADDFMLLTNFETGSADLGWYVVNDNVMGGRSEGDFRVRDGELVFAGRTNTNGGGFSSIRTRPVDVDLASHAGIQLRVLGDGRRYTWRLATTNRWRGRPVSYWAEFDTRAGEWMTVRLPFADFVPRFRGYELQGPDLDPALVTGMGLMIYDGRDGDFELHIKSVHAYADGVLMTRNALN